MTRHGAVQAKCQLSFHAPLPALLRWAPTLVASASLWPVPNPLGKFLFIHDLFSCKNCSCVIPIQASLHATPQRAAVGC